MCGIAGIFRLAGAPQAEDVAAVLRMLDAQAHRGPDDWGVLVPDSVVGAAAWPDGANDRVLTYPAPGDGPGAVLGSRRLAIIDLSPAARMPLGTPDRLSFIVHNGEIYNHGDLRAELASTGVAFASGSDAETVLRAHAAWREGALHQLRGMFAFAIFEARPRPRLLLARDRLGVKPLYYAHAGPRLAFASEVRALLRSGLVDGALEPEAVIRYLQWGSVPAPLTTARGVLALPPGHLLDVSNAGPSVRRWYRPGAAGPLAAVSPDAAVAGTRDRLEECVRLHLASDVPLGVFLSGGVDSSALVALASRERPALATLSVVFEEPRYSEAVYARAVARRYGTDHREILLRADEVLDALPAYWRAMDQPTVDGVNTYFVSSAARAAGLTVVLSGIGGDELFLGYGHLRRARALRGLERALAAVPAAPRRALLRLAASGGAALGRAGLEKLEYLERPGDDLALYRALRGLFAPAQVRALLGIEAAQLDGYGHGLRDERGAVDRDAVDTLARLELGHYVGDQLLKDADVMSMAHGVELRVPYLDHELVEWAQGLPARVKLAPGVSKPLLLRALDGALPREVWDRPKMGFTFPFAQWLRQRADELSALDLEDTPLDRRAVREVWAGFGAGRLHWSRPWALLALSRFLGGRSRVPA